MSSENPRQWRFTWEAQSHSPILKLFLSSSFSKPSIHCKNLDVQLNISRSLLLVNWLQDDTGIISLRVPIPKLLIDPDSPLTFRVFDDHIQVKLVLLLPVNHPIFTDLTLSDDGAENEVSDSVKPLVMDSDMKSLSSMKGVHFYCRSCSTRLTTNLIRDFVEMPSVNWREMADNWFGGCCCSFGGASEKLVDRYADAYTCTKGICLLNSTAVTLCKDDLLGFKFADWDGIRRYEHKKEFSVLNDISKKQMTGPDSLPGKDIICDGDSENLFDADGIRKSSDLDSDNLGENIKCEVKESEANRLLGVPQSEVFENIASRLGCCHLTHPAQDHVKTNLHEVSQHALADLKTEKAVETLVNRRSLLNGFLGDVFMAKSYNHSVDIEWKQFVCPQCSTPLGAYPCVDGKLPIDDGVRLFKCYLSTSLPVGTKDDLFRQYNLEKMFANLLMESAKDELSFRTVVKDLTTKSPMLQVVLVNPDSWCCSGICDSEYSTESVPKLELQPVIKLLFSDCSNKIPQLRVFEDWSKDEVYMLPFLVESLIKTITSKKELFPPSCTLFNDLSSSFMLR
ncbi:uncharacterized protein [Euphorbia lathyris]|uniref:uncharacterized protein n=1 Tax=Euphorbia lathyris TaxID=212925 RepID=UPI003313D790